MSDESVEKYRPKNLPIYFPFLKFKWDQFFVGVFGAAAVFGVLMKLWKEPFWGLVSAETGQLLYDVMMPVGFLGECIVFIIMGFQKGEEYIEVYPEEQVEHDSEEVEEDSSAGEIPEQAQGVVVNMELPDSLKDLIEEKVSDQLDNKVSELTNLLVEDIEKTRGLLVDTNEINSHIQEVNKSLSDFSEKLQNIGSSLSKFENIDADTVSKHADSVSEHLENTGSELEEFENEMKKLSERFRSFNATGNRN